MPPSIQKPQKSSPNLGAHLADQRFGVEVAGPRDDRLDRAVEVARRWLRRWRGRRRAASASTISSRMRMASLAALPFGLGAQQVFLGDHFEDRADVLGHAAVDQHEAVLQLAGASRRRHPRRSRMWCVGSRRPRLMPYSGSPSPASAPSISLMPGQMPPESCQPPPEPPSHSPRIARAATSRRSSSSSGPFRALGLAGGAHAHGDQRGQQVGRDRQPRAFGDVVDLADHLEAVPRPAGEPRQQIGQRLRRSLRCPAERCRRRSPPALSRPR